MALVTRTETFSRDWGWPRTPNSISCPLVRADGGLALFAQHLSLKRRGDSPGYRKGRPPPGRDADIVIWNHAGAPADLHHRHKLTGYHLADFPAAVEATFLRGQKIYERGHFASAPLGAILKP